MKLKVKIAEKQYVIQCGSGRQNVFWVGLVACRLYGQEHYPKGNFVPNLIKAENGEIPHPRLKLRDVFKEGELVHVIIKDRSRPQTEEEKNWYDKAFGHLRNMMKVNITYAPIAESLRDLDFDVYANMEYNMFPELYGEFGSEAYPPKQEILLEKLSEKGEENYFGYEMHLPFGDIKFEIFGKKKGEIEKKKMPQTEQDNLQLNIEPKPISEEEQLLIDQEEEKENLRMENEARMAQKRQEEAKARDAFEKQQQLIQMQQISNKLEMIWNAMDTSFIENEEIGNECVSILSMFYLDISDLFSFYAALQPQVFNQKDNELITLQGFQHFCKLYKLARTREDFAEICTHLEHIIAKPLTDSLNIRNGMNIAQFVEALLRACIITDNRKDESGRRGLVHMLQETLQNASEDFKNRLLNDDNVKNFYTEGITQLCEDNFYTLSGVFSLNGVLVAQTHIDIPKEEIITILKEAKMFGEESVKQRMEIIKKRIAEVPAFSPDHYGYVDFIYILFETSQQPWFASEFSLPETAIPEERFALLLKKMNTTYGKIGAEFADEMKKKTSEMNYDPPPLVSDETIDDENEFYDEEEKI